MRKNVKLTVCSLLGLLRGEVVEETGNTAGDVAGDVEFESMAGDKSTNFSAEGVAGITFSAGVEETEPDISPTESTDEGTGSKLTVLKAIPRSMRSCSSNSSSNSSSSLTELLAES